MVANRIAQTLAFRLARDLRGTVRRVKDRSMTSPFQSRQPGGSARLDEPGTALLADAAARAQRYLERLGDRDVAPSPEAVLALGELEFPLPETGLEPA